MKKLIILVALMTSVLRAEAEQVFNIIDKPADMLSVLSELLLTEKEGQVERSSDPLVELTALNSIGYKLVDIRFIGDEGYCSAELTFLSPDNSNQKYMSFSKISKEDKRRTPFDAYCTAKSE